MKDKIKKAIISIIVLFFLFLGIKVFLSYFVFSPLRGEKINILEEICYSAIFSVVYYFVIPYVSKNFSKGLKSEEIKKPAQENEAE